MSDYYGSYNNSTFGDIWPTVDTFLADFAAAPFPNEFKYPEKTPSLIYYLLFARYCNSSIAASSLERFKLSVFQRIWTYGPVLEMRREIQQSIRNLNLEEIIQGGKAIYNHALNPGTGPASTSLEELPTIADQNVTNYKRNKLEGYQALWDMLRDNYVDAFTNRFNKLFIFIYAPDAPKLYFTPEEVNTDD